MRQFYGRLENAFFLQEKTHVHKIPRFGRGGVFWFLGGGGCTNVLRPVAQDMAMHS